MKSVRLHVISCLNPAPLEGISWPLKRLHSKKLVDKTLVESQDYTALYRRLSDICGQRPLAKPFAPAICVGIVDAQGSLVHVVRTTSIVQAVRVFELLGEFDLTPCEGRRRTEDGLPLTRVYRQSPGRSTEV
jgi:hypothetical protein